MAMDTLADLSSVALVAAYRRGDASPVEATRAVLDRIQNLNGVLNAFVHLDEVATLKSAARAEMRWRQGSPLSGLDGIPVSVKDLLDVAGWPTRKGSLTTSRHPAVADAPSVERLRRAGVVFTGKTATSEFGWKCVTDSPLTGVTRNPWNPELTPGGSSGGAAAAAAAGLGPVHFGTDGAGSIRVPASFCGVVGFKPTYGLIPHAPPAHTGDLFHAGPIARTVSDVACLLDVVAANKPWRSPDTPETSLVDVLGNGPLPKRVRFFPSLTGATVSPVIDTAARRAAKALEDMGVDVIETPPLTEDFRTPFDLLWSSGAARLITGIPNERQKQLEKGLAALAERGGEYSQDEVAQAQTARRALAASIQRLFEQADLVLTPTVPVPPFSTSALIPKGGGFRTWVDWTPFSYPFNLTQSPAVSIPFGETQDGMPIGVQLVGNKYDDARVLRTAQRLLDVRPPTWPHPDRQRADDRQVG